MARRISQGATVAILALVACTPEAPAPTDTASATPTPMTPASPTASPRQASLIPEPFLGIWDVAGGQCSPASDLRIEIAERGVTFYESHGAVTSVTVESPTRLVVDLAMQGEGEKWTVKQRFTLSDGGRTLTPEAVGDDQYTPVPRERCA